MAHTSSTARRVAALLCAVASACGGGGGGSESPVADAGSGAPGNACASSAPVVSKDYIALPSADDLVRNLCTEQSRSGGLSTQVAIADMNGDGRQDVVAVYWCAYSFPGQDYTGPVPNTLLVYLSQPDGTYVIGNRRLFGTDIVDIGGWSNEFTISDFNGDGRPDVGISVSKEDMRARGSVGLMNWVTPQVVLLSKADGSYSVERFTVVASGPIVQAVDNEVGGVDFVYINHASGPPAAFRWTGGGWQDVPGYPRVNTAMTFWPRSQSGQGSSKVLSTSLDPADGNASLQIQERRSGEWTSTSKYVIPSRRIEVIGWNQERTQTTLATVNGIRMLYATFEEACVMRMSPTGRDDIVLARILGFVTPPDWDGTSLLDERYLNGTTLLLPFSTTDGLVPMPDLLVDPPKGMSFTDFQCVDINRDGYTDLVINTQGAAHRGTLGGPIFYLNNRAGRLVRAEVPDLPAMPGTEIGWSATTSAVRDMNGDGVPDLLYFTTYGQSSQLGQPFRLYLRRRLVD